jgi:hypothetical protein
MKGIASQPESRFQAGEVVYFVNWPMPADQEVHQSRAFEMLMKATAEGRELFILRSARVEIADGSGANDGRVLVTTTGDVPHTLEGMKPADTVLVEQDALFRSEDIETLIHEHDGWLGSEEGTLQELLADPKSNFEIACMLGSLVTEKIAEVPRLKDASVVIPPPTMVLAPPPVDPVDIIQQRQSVA